MSFQLPTNFVIHFGAIQHDISESSSGEASYETLRMNVSKIPQIIWYIFIHWEQACK